MHGSSSSMWWRALCFLGFALAASLIPLMIKLVDRPVVGFLHATAGDPVASLVAILDVIGSPIPYFLVSAGAFLVFKFHYQNVTRANAALFSLLASTVAPLSTDLLHLLFGRSRPRLLWEQGVYTFRPFTNDLAFTSFPSEHATVVAAMALTSSILAPDYRPTFFFLAIIAASSQVVGGLSYPSDVIAGAVVGVATVVILRTVFRRYKLNLHRT